MTTHTSTKHLMDSEALYNALMWQIEPELTTEMLPDLVYIYEDESDENRAMRKEWYLIAFELFRERHAELMDACANHIRGLKNMIQFVYQKDAAHADADQLHSIEQSMDTL